MLCAQRKLHEHTILRWSPSICILHLHKFDDIWWWGAAPKVFAGFDYDLYHFSKTSTWVSTQKNKLVHGIKIRSLQNVVTETEGLIQLLSKSSILHDPEPVLSSGVTRNERVHGILPPMPPCICHWFCPPAILTIHLVKLYCNVLLQYPPQSSKWMFSSGFVFPPKSLSRFTNIILNTFWYAVLWQVYIV